MSIKKVAMCPFCKHEMTKEEGSIYYEGAIIVTERGYKDVPIASGASQISIPVIKDTIHLQMYICQQCGFVAFWKYEL